MRRLAEFKQTPQKPRFSQRKTGIISTTLNFIFAYQTSTILLPLPFLLYSIINSLRINYLRINIFEETPRKHLKYTISIYIYLIYGSQKYHFIFYFVLVTLSSSGKLLDLANAFSVLIFKFFVPRTRITAITSEVMNGSKIKTIYSSITVAILKNTQNIKKLLKYHLCHQNYLPV